MILIRKIPMKKIKYKNFFRKISEIFWTWGQKFPFLKIYIYFFLVNYEFFESGFLFSRLRAKKFHPEI